MAQMPRGEPRSVPDQDAKSWAAMVGQEKLKRELAESALFSPLGGPLDFLQRPSRRDPIVTIGGRTYREFDNGRANVLVPADDPWVSQAQRAERQRAIRRASFMADHPLGSVAYGLATLANASPAARDGALMAVGLADAAVLGLAARGAPVRGLPPPPRGEPAPSPRRRDDVRYGKLNANGQAAGMTATLMAPLSPGKRARGTPPGWQGHGKDHNEARAHLLARQFGGAASPTNIVTMTHRGANTPQMSDFERGVARRVRAGEVVEYSVTPLYGKGVLPPSATLLTVYGSRGAPSARIIPNPAGRRR